VTGDTADRSLYFFLAARARSETVEGSIHDMSEPFRLAAEALGTETLEATRDLEGSGDFETFYEAESQTLFRRLWLVTGNRAEAEELMQDAFLKLWERWDRVGTMDDPVGYLYRTAMNLVRKRHRRALLAIRRTLRLVPAGDDFAEAEDRETVRRVLSTLPPRQRAALVLTEMLGFDSNEAGRALGVRGSTVRSLTRKGRDSFRRAMEVDDA
jgi:RNA polymerase sigma-70 factor (ECF subfamily)